MFFRIKPSGDRRYLQIVENTRDGARTVQRVLATLGRVEDLEADGRLDALLRSGARFSETAMLLSSHAAGALDSSTSLRIGAPMLFGRLWEQSGCRRAIEQLAQKRGFGFSLERAVFVSVLHRLMISGSDRACEKWLDAYLIDGADGLDLHQLYRAMAWLGEELADQSDATRAPRRIKDVIEETLFARRRGLFSDLSVVLFDTTSLMFYGAGGETLGQRGKSKDPAARRADRIATLRDSISASSHRPVTDAPAGQRDDVARHAPSRPPATLFQVPRGRGKSPHRPHRQLPPRRANAAYLRARSTACRMSLSPSPMGPYSQTSMAASSNPTACGPPLSIGRARFALSSIPVTTLGRAVAASRSPRPAPPTTSATANSPYRQRCFMRRHSQALFLAQQGSTGAARSGV